MIGYFSILSVMLVALAFVFGVRIGVMATLLLHPVAAAGWHVNYYLLGIKVNPLVLLGFLVPMFIFFRAFTKGPSFASMPLAGIWIVYICYNIFAGTLHAMDEGPGRSLNLIFRHLGGFVGFYMMQAFFTKREDFKRLTFAIVLSGLFPVLVILYQIASGTGTLRELSEGGDLRLDSAMGLVRYSGFFHDIVSVRGYVFQCLAGIILYWAYFIRPNRDAVMKAALAFLGIACIFVLYKMYSKAAILTLAMWFIIWSIGYKKLGLGITLGVLAVGVNLIHGNLVLSETEQLFQTEIAEATSGNVQTNRLLHGRVGVWLFALEGFFNASLFEHIFGFRTGAGLHNDFLQKLFYGGFVGLIIYIVLLWKIGFRVLRLNLQEMTPINLMAAMIFAGWMVDTIGVVPSLYPGYQWYAWGLIGLAVKGLEFEKGEESAPARRTLTGPIWLQGKEKES